MVQVDQEQTTQARRESKMDAMGTCTYVKGRPSVLHSSNCINMFLASCQHARQLTF